MEWAYLWFPSYICMRVRTTYLVCTPSATHTTGLGNGCRSPRCQMQDRVQMSWVSLPNTAWCSVTMLSRGSSTITSSQNFCKKSSWRPVAKFLRHYTDMGAISRKPGSGRPSKMTADIKRIVDEQMTRDNETIAHQLRHLLVSKGYDISLRTILCSRMLLG